MTKQQQSLHYRFFKMLQPSTFSFLFIHVLVISFFGSNQISASESTSRQDSTIEELNFQVLLDDSEIGFHRFRMEKTPDSQTIDIDANFKVTFLGIPFYRYMHTNREMWRSGCLESIASNTDDNGDQFIVEGSRNPSGFSINTGRDQQAIDNTCIMTFAYWNKNFLKRQQLLNSQNGDWLAVDIDFIGAENISLGGEKLTAEKYRIRNTEKDIDITVWYEGATDRWLSLESRVSGDRLLRYIPVAGNAANKGK